MAQVAKKGALVRARRLARRYGVTGRAVGTAALCAIAVTLAILGIILGGSAAGVELERGDEAVEAASGAGNGAGPSEAEAKTIWVHVDGAVASPGVYCIAEGARVNDAVTAAGGLSEGADTSTVNLASVVMDGSKVHIPSSDELGSGAGDESGAGSQEVSATGSGIVNINTATSEELQTLSGVGEATAAAIIEDRESNGLFSSPEDLMRVSGIGEKKFAKIRERICV